MILTPRSRAKSRAEGVTMVPVAMRSSPEAGTSAAMMTCFTPVSSLVPCSRRLLLGIPGRGLHLGDLLVVALGMKRRVNQPLICVQRAKYLERMLDRVFL